MNINRHGIRICHCVFCSMWQRVPDAGPEPDLVRIGIGGIANTAFCSILQWRKEREAEGLLKLSHSFMQKTEHPELELLVKVLNINLDKNLEILETCRLLKKYMLLVHKYGSMRLNTKISIKRLKRL